MVSVRILSIACVAFVLGAHPLAAQDLSRYRDFSLGSGLASVVKISGAQEREKKTLHARPARIEELEWRVGYARSSRDVADPVRDVVFTFYDDQLYQIVVTYDRNRMEGLTNDDVIESVSSSYGVPLLRYARRAGSPTEVPAETSLAQWEDDASLVTLLRGGPGYSPQYQLVLTSKALSVRAKGAIADALKLDKQEAPQRELDARNQAVEDARVAKEKARTVNKPAFRP